MNLRLFISLLITVILFSGCNRGFDKPADETTLNSDLQRGVRDHQKYRPGVSLKVQKLRREILKSKFIDKLFWKKINRLPVRPVDGVKIAVYRSINETLFFTYRNINGLAVADGDIILGPYDFIDAQQATLRGEGPVGATFALVAPQLGQRWPNGVVYYDYADDFEAEDEVEAAIAEYELKTPVDFRRRGNQQNYIMFVNQLTFPYLSSMSPVGMTRGRQDVKIQTRNKQDTSQLKDPVLLKRSALHEIGHSLGFKHEHTRADREQWIAIDEDCIDFWYNISGNYAIAENFIYFSPYDFRSIMHYPTSSRTKGPPWDQQACFDMVRQPQHRTEADSTGEIFPSFSLSRHDINALHHMYGVNGLSSQNGDRYGQSLLKYDFDKDGFDDLAVGLPFKRAGNTGSRSGAVLVYKGTANGFVLWKNLLPDTPQANQRFGTALAAGDFDNDGINDIAIGAPGTIVNGKSSAGRVYIFTMRGNRLSEQYMQMPKPVGINDEAIESMDRFGQSLAAGRFNSVNADNLGRTHLAIGAPGARFGSAGRTGRVWIFDEGKLLNIRKIDPDTMDLIAFGQLGYSLATIPEHTRGTEVTVDKLAISAPAFTWLDCQKIPVYIAGLSGDYVRLLQALTRPEPTPFDGYCPHDTNIQPVIDFFPEVWSTNYGTSMVAGDFDGDGDQDLAAGAFFGPEDAPFGKGGRAYIFRQAASTGTFELQHFVTQDGLDTDNPLDSFAWSLSVSDIDNDGMDDLAVGATTDIDSATDLRMGRIFLFKGCVTSPNSSENPQNCQGSLAPWKTYGQSANQSITRGIGFGASLALGDFNDDQLVDIAVGAPFKGPNNQNLSGAVFFMTGNDENSILTQEQVLTQEYITPFLRP